jgi:phage/plasmid-associated DNA primase
MEKHLIDRFRDLSNYDNAFKQQYTHLIVYPQDEHLNIKSDKKSDFWYEYCHGVENEDFLCIAEKPQEYMPIIADLTFRFVGSAGDTDAGSGFPEHDCIEVITESFTRRIVSCFQEVIESLFQLTEEKIELYCALIYHQKTWIETYKGHRCTVSGMRLQFPFCRIEAIVAKQLLFERVKRVFHQRNIISELSQQPLGGWDEILDMDSMEKPILLYGSTGSNETPISYSYRLFDVITHDMLDESQDPEAYLYDIFKLPNHEDVRLRYLEAKDMIDDEIELDFWIPLFFSIKHWERITSLKSGPKNGIGAPQINIRSSGKVDNPTDYELCETFLRMLSAERFNKKEFWINIGKALYHATGGTEKGLDKWIEVTSRSKNKDLDEYLCREYWCGGFYFEHITYETLAWYAREDSKEAFDKWHDSWIEPMLESALPKPQQADNHTDTAEAFRRIFFLRFKYATDPNSKNVKTGTWYTYGSISGHRQAHRWSVASDSIEILKAMSDQFRSKYEQLRIKYATQVAQSNDDAYKLQMESKIKSVQTMISKLRSQPFKKNILNEAKERMHCEYFKTVLDDNPTCIACLNCVAEAVDNEIVFRNGKPEDYLSKCTNVMIDFKMDWNHPRVKQYTKWTSQTFPDKELYECHHKYISSFFVAGNADKKLVGWTGDRDNSKSATIKALECAFGDYVIKFSTSMSTSKGKANGPTPELAQAKGARLVIQDEFEEDDIQQSGFIKRMTGGDSFFGRMLNENGGKIKVTFKMIQVFNKIPRMNSVHASIRERFFIIPFISTWSDDAPEDEDEQIKQRLFRKNPHFEAEIPKMASAILWVAAQYFPKYKTEGLRKPAIVKKMTEEYWNDIDMFQTFAKENLTEVYIKGKEGDPAGRDKNFKVDITKVYNEFKIWFKLNYEGEKPINIRDFKHEMVKRFGKLSEDKWWYGVNLVNEGVPQFGGNKLPK